MHVGRHGHGSLRCGPIETHDLCLQARCEYCAAARLFHVRTHSPLTIFSSHFCLISRLPTPPPGFVISGHRILTNAHVVADHTFVLVRKHGSPKKFLAKVIHSLPAASCTTRCFHDFNYGGVVQKLAHHYDLVHELHISRSRVLN